MLAVGGLQVTKEERTSVFTLMYARVARSVHPLTKKIDMVFIPYSFADISKCKFKQFMVDLSFRAFFKFFNDLMKINSCTGPHHQHFHIRVLLYLMSASEGGRQKADESAGGDRTISDIHFSAT